jgi:hypothetical protein
VGRSKRIIAVVAGVLSVVVLVALFASRPRAYEPGAPAPTQPAPVRERGDPVLAGQLAEQARRLSGQDPQGALRLLMAAHAVDPDSAVHRIALSEALLGAVQPVSLIQTKLDTGGPITYAAASSDASYLITSATTGRLWQTGWITNPGVRLAANLDTPVAAAAGAGTLSRTNLVVAGGGVVSHWRAATPVSAQRLGQLTPHADAVAVTADGATAVTVDATTATLWDVDAPDAEAKATLTYDKPVTTVTFATGTTLVLAAGHADGSVTVHTIDLDKQTTKKKTLTSGRGPVDAVALSSDASTALGLHADGTMSVWDLKTASPEPVGTAAAVVAVGPRRVWLSATGDYAFIADATGPPVLWSLADRRLPSRMLVLPVGANPAVPAMISADGLIVVTIDRANALAIWDIKPFVGVLADPFARACQLAGLDNETWRRMVPNGAFTNPCVTTSLPSLKVDGG